MPRYLVTLMTTIAVKVDAPDEQEAEFVAYDKLREVDGSGYLRSALEIDIDNFDVETVVPTHE